MKFLEIISHFSTINAVYAKLSSLKVHFQLPMNCFEDRKQNKIWWIFRFKICNHNKNIIGWLLGIYIVICVHNFKIFSDESLAQHLNKKRRKGGRNKQNEYFWHFSEQVIDCCKKNVSECHKKTPSLFRIDLHLLDWLTDYL